MFVVHWQAHSVLFQWGIATQPASSHLSSEASAERWVLIWPVLADQGLATEPFDVNLFYIFTGAGWKWVLAHLWNTETYKLTCRSQWGWRSLE